MKMDNRKNEHLCLDENIWSRMGDEIEPMIQRANAACRNQFVFTHPWDMEYCDDPITFTGKIDWTYCYKGDPEWAFMINRQRFMAELGIAYAVSGDETYVKHWKRIFHEWVEANRETSIHKYTWRKIDTGIRLTNWLKGYRCICRSNNWTHEDDMFFREQIDEHVTFLSASFTPFDYQSNWGFLETNGLVQGAFFLEDETTDLWIEKAIARLEKMITLQIDRDGMQKEQSPMYHHEVLPSLLDISITFRRSHASVPSFIDCAANRMLTAYYQIMKPNGHQPMLGDSDDTDIRSTLGIGAVLFNRPDLRKLTSENCPFDVLWYFGQSGLRIYETMKQHSPTQTSIHLEDSGITVFRTGWEHDDHYLLFDHGSMGQVNKGHGHDDNLHLEMFASGRELLIDGGRYTYCEGQERAYFKSSHRHNTVTVDGYDASEYEETWKWKKAAEPIDQKALFTEHYQFAQAGHTGFWRLASPVHVTRKVIHIPDAYDIVIDCFMSEGKHDYTQHFHFPENTPIENDSVKLMTDVTNGENMIIFPFNVPNEIELGEGCTSRPYNKMTKHPHIEVTYKQRQTFAAPFMIIPPGDENRVTITKQQVYHINGEEKKDIDVVAYEMNLEKRTDIVICSLSGNDSFLVGDYQVCGELILIKAAYTEQVEICSII